MFLISIRVVVATTKVRIFKQITTKIHNDSLKNKLLLLPQRYVFSSKSQLMVSCLLLHLVVVATTKVRIFKQITTDNINSSIPLVLLLLPQRYVFSSKSQHILTIRCIMFSCCCYHKGTYFQANHNHCLILLHLCLVVVATTKVRIFKQITTKEYKDAITYLLLLLPQRYVFSSKSQLVN